MPTLYVCEGACNPEAGTLTSPYEILQSYVKENDLSVRIEKIGCQGLCGRGHTVVLENKRKRLYFNDEPYPGFDFFLQHPDPITDIILNMKKYLKRAA